MSIFSSMTGRFLHRLVTDIVLDCNPGLTDLQCKSRRSLLLRSVPFADSPSSLSFSPSFKPSAKVPTPPIRDAWHSEWRTLVALHVNNPRIAATASLFLLLPLLPFPPLLRKRETDPTLPPSSLPSGSQEDLQGIRC